MVMLQTNEAERLARQLSALNEIAKTLTSPLDLPELLEAVMDRIIGVSEPAQIGAIMLWDQSAGLFRPEASFGFNEAIFKNIGLRAGESITGKVFDEGRARLLSTPDQVAEMMVDMREANRTIMSRSLGTDAVPLCTIATPLMVGDQKYGVLVLETMTGSNTFTEDDLPFLQVIADLVALAIDRARLEARADAIREAQQVDRLRSEVMATLSHQLRMPLTAIKGYATALLLDEVEWNKDKQQEFLKQIDEETDNMQGMIRELLDSSLIDVGQLLLEKQPVRLPQFCTEIVLEFQRHYENHRLIVDFPPHFPILEVDLNWTRQVFRNIIDNAIKYSPQGGLVVIRGEIRTADVVISVADQGVGISPEDLIPLFEKYFRVKSESVRVAGTGLGLPIARAIVEAHGGRIWAESKVGQGTTIFFTFPIPKNSSLEE